MKFEKKGLFLNSIDIRRFFNFSDSSTKELKDFSIFNLFIGPNGSGKSNILKFLNSDFYQFGLGQNHFKPSFIATYSNHNYGFIYPGHPKRDCLIEIKSNQRTYEYGRKNSKNGNESDVRGFFSLNQIQLVNPSSSTELLEKNLFKHFKEEKPEEALEFISFAIWQIFGFRFRFEKLSVFEEIKIEGKNIKLKEIENLKCLSSGVVSVFNLLSEILLCRGNKILCLDEPEVHLEPRIIRKFIELIFYLILKKGPYYQDIPIDSFKEIDQNFNNFFQTKKAKTNYCGLSQLFIISHSPSVINTFFKVKDLSSIYEFNLKSETLSNTDFFITYPQTGITRSVRELVGEVKRSTFLSSDIRKVALNTGNLLSNIGSNGSDLLQTNGIVWVEGPSDGIYINKWLEIYAKENKLKVFKRGIHFQFLSYGGALLGHYSYEDIFDNNTQGKLINMFLINHNAFIVMDSDAYIDEGIIKDKSNFKKAKDNIYDVVTKKLNPTPGIWYDRDNVSLTTIESYLDEESKKNAKSISGSKVKKAITVVNSWDANLKLRDFNIDLLEHIKDLYSNIEKWNN